MEIFRVRVEHDADSSDLSQFISYEVAAFCRLFVMIDEHIYLHESLLSIPQQKLTQIIKSLKLS